MHSFIPCLEFDAFHYSYDASGSLEFDHDLATDLDDISLKEKADT